MSGRFIGAEQVATIKARSDIVSLMGEYSTLKKAGANFVGCCPFHQERTPSMHVYPDSGTYHCFGCAAHGDAIELVKEKERLDFGDAVELLARRIGHTITYSDGAAAGSSRARAGEREACVAAMEFATKFYEYFLWSSPAPLAQEARAYLASRGLSEATCRRFRLGWAPGNGALVAEARAHSHAPEILVATNLAVDRNGRPSDRFFERIMFPICNRFGSAIAFSGRLLPEAEAKAKADGLGIGKYVNTAATTLFDKSAVVFNLHRAREAVKEQSRLHRPLRLVIMEGATDVMAADQAGVGEVVACLGTALTVEHVVQLGRIVGERGLLYVCLDGDKAGKEKAPTAARVLLAAGVQGRIVTLPNGLDPAELFAGANASEVAMTLERFEEALASAPNELEFLLSVVAPEPKALDDRGRLAAAKFLLDAIRPMPDLALRELFLVHIARRMGIRQGLLADHLEEIDAVHGTKNAQQTPAGQAVVGQAAALPIGDERRSRVPSNAYHVEVIEALRLFISSRKITPDAVGGWMRVGTEQAISQNNKEMIGAFLLEYRHHKGVSSTYVVETLDALMAAGRRARRAEVIARFCGQLATDAGREALVAWVKAVTGGTDPLHIAVMKHWIWQIKRLASGKRTQHDMMPILVGRQGKGKSTATDKLCEPWCELVTDIKVENLTDERKFNILSTCIIGRWEEMQGASKGDVAALKHAISSPLVCYRQLATHIHERELRTMGFIGTSNDPVDQLISDQTGMRRFFEIPAEHIDQKAINAIDYHAIWLSVSENDEAPILAHLDAVRVEQAQLVHRDAVALWLEGENWERLELIEEGVPFGTTDGGGAPRLIVPAYDPAVGTTFDHLSVRFKAWCRRVGQPLSQVTRLAQRLPQEGFTTTRPRVNGVVGPRRYHRPLPPAPPAPSGPTRGARLEADPSPAEDHFRSPEDMESARYEAEERAAIEAEGQGAPPAADGGDDAIPL